MKKHLPLILMVALVSFTIGSFWGPKISPKVLPKGPTPSPSYEFIPRAPQASSSAKFSKKYVESLSKDEKEVANLIENKASLSENYFLIRVNSKEGPLDITDCEPKPIALRAVYDSDFKVINRNDKGHMINVGSFEGYVPPKKDREFRANFKAGPGVYMYSCDRYPKGVMWLYPKGLFPHE